MSAFDKLPIGRKLMLLGLVTNGAALVILSIVLGASEWSSYRNRAVNSIRVHAGVIADNAASALVFSDEKAAAEILSRLKAEPAVVYAALLDRSGKLVARFETPGNQKAPVLLLTPEQPLFFASQLAYAKSVVYDGEAVGTLHLQTDLRDAYSELLRKLGLLAAAMAASLVLAFILFVRFQKTLSQPIRDLAEAMRRVTEDNDYSVKADVPSRDELSMLAQGFNTMLQAIRVRDEALARHSDALEETVKQRTLELERLNLNLEQRVRDEVAKNREKDHLMIRQSRLAAIGEMIGNIAHQWRQPLNTLTLLLANIKDAYEYSELTREYLDESVKDGQGVIQRMSTTIDDFRNFFRPNKEKTHFSVNETVTDSLHILKATLDNSNIAVSVDSEQDVTAYGYRNEYLQVLVNILNNAKDAIKERKISVGLIRITISSREEQAEVAIEDNAGGIAPEVLPKIFDPYFTTREKGTGIGLYMSKMIIENSMKGSITAHNTGQGARFVVITPADVSGKAFM